MKSLVVTICLLALMAAAAYAAPVDVPTTLKKEIPEREKVNPWNDWNHPVSWAASVEGDMVAERELDLENGEAEGMFYGAKFTLPLYLLGQWDWYGQVGMANNAEVSARVNGSDVTYEFEDGYSWGAGANYIFINNQENGIGLFADVKYRVIEDTGYDQVTVGNTAFTTYTSSNDARWDEWQAALGLSKRWEKLMVYGGPKMTETAIDADVTVGGTRYEFNNARTDMMYGAFLGALYQFNENLSLELEGRAGDEMGYSGKLVLKF